VSQEINPYQAPGGDDPVDRSEWTHSFVQTSLDLGEVGLVIGPDELVIDVPKSKRRVRVPRHRHFETLQMFRSFTRLKVSPPISLTLPAEIRDTLLAWRGGSTREWLRYDLSRGRIWLWVASGFFGLIFFSQFIPAPDGGYSLLNPLATAAIGLGFACILLRTALANRFPHRAWFLMDIAFSCLFILHFLLNRDSIWWLIFMFVLFLPSIVHALRRFKLHREGA